MLDSDKDGWISSQSIEVGALSADILEGFAAMLIEMEECDIEMNLEMFTMASEKLLSVISFTERDKILLSHQTEK